MRTQRCLAVVVVLAALTACGSTAQQTGLTAAPGQTAFDDGLWDGSGSPELPGPTTGAPLSPTASAPTGQVLPTVDSQSPTAVATGGSPPTTSGAVSSAAKTPVRLGFTVVPDASAFFASFGGDTENVDQASLMKSAVAWVNAHGGLNGHPIQPFIEAVSATSTQPYDQQYQALCEKYKRDHKVIAAGMVGIGTNTNMDACMQKAGLLFQTGSGTLHDEADYGRTPLVFSPREVTASVLAKTLAQLVVSKGLVKRGGKLGLLNFDIPAYNRAVENQMKPVLAAAGITLTRYTIPPPSSTADIANSVTVVQSAQLRMRSEGVDTVTFLCGGCVAFFIQASNAQGYYPRYVVSSLDAPGKADGASYARPLANAYAVSWELGDRNEFDRSPFVRNSSYQECLKVQKAAGRSPDTIAIAMITCDEVLYFQAAARANPVEPITTASLAEGFRRLGSSRPSALTFATDLSGARHAGASHYRLMTWSAPCSCMSHTGPLLPFPRP